MRGMGYGYQHGYLHGWNQNLDQAWNQGGNQAGNVDLSENDVYRPWCWLVGDNSSNNIYPWWSTEDNVNSDFIPCHVFYNDNVNDLTDPLYKPTCWRFDGDVNSIYSINNGSEVVQISGESLQNLSAVYGFNEHFYNNMYCDVDDAVNSGNIISGIEHFCLWGIEEGRRPNLAYDQNYYLQNNPDVAEAVNQGLMTGYHHFVNYGQYEGRQGSAEFNANCYLAANPDIAEAINAGLFSTPFEYYVLKGQFEDRPLCQTSIDDIGLQGMDSAESFDITLDSGVFIW